MVNGVVNFVSEFGPPAYAQTTSVATPVRKQEKRDEKEKLQRKRN